MLSNAFGEQEVRAAGSWGGGGVGASGVEVGPRVRLQLCRLARKSMQLRAKRAGPREAGERLMQSSSGQLVLSGRATPGATAWIAGQLARSDLSPTVPVHRIRIA